MFRLCATETASNAFTGLQINTRMYKTIQKLFLRFEKVTVKYKGERFPGAAEKCWAVMELFVNIYLYEFVLSLVCVRRACSLFRFVLIELRH